MITENTPAYLRIGSDCYPYTVVEVKNNGKRIIVQTARHKVIGGEWPDLQYECFPNPNGIKRVFTLRKDGRYRAEGESLKSTQVLYIGHYRYYQDPHF